jgi:hypothetical protein
MRPARRVRTSSGEQERARTLDFPWWSMILSENRFPLFRIML